MMENYDQTVEINRNSNCSSISDHLLKLQQLVAQDQVKVMCY